MTLELSPPVRRFLAVGLLLVAAALLWTLLVAPLLNAQRDAEDTIERLQPVLDRSRIAARDIGALEAEVMRVQAQRTSQAGFLDGANESIAAAQLQNRLKLAVDHVGGTLQSVQVLPPRDEARFRRVTVRGQIVVGLAGLQRVVYDLEGALPDLFVDAIAVQQRVATKTDGDVPLLDVRLDVSGYMRKAL